MGGQAAEVVGAALRQTTSATSLQSKQAALASSTPGGADPGVPPHARTAHMQQCPPSFPPCRRLLRAPAARRGVGAGFAGRREEVASLEIHVALNGAGAFGGCRQRDACACLGTLGALCGCQGGRQPSCCKSTVISPGRCHLLTCRRRGRRGGTGGGRGGRGAGRGAGRGCCSGNLFGAAAGQGRRESRRHEMHMP